MTTTRTVRLLQVRYAPGPEGPWSEPHVRNFALVDSPIAGWSRPLRWTNEPDKAWHQTRIVEAVLPPDDPASAPPSPAEWEVVELLTQLDRALSVRDTSFSGDIFVSALVVRGVLKALREAAGVREHLGEVQAMAEKHVAALTSELESAEKRLAEAEALLDDAPSTIFVEDAAPGWLARVGAFLKGRPPSVETKACPECGGDRRVPVGEMDEVTCPTCEGVGRVPVVSAVPVAHHGAAAGMACAACNGTGKSIPAGGKGAE